MTSTIAKPFVAFVAFAVTAMLVTGLSTGAFAGHHRAHHHVLIEGARTDPNTVMSGGQYVGRDPDANVRAQMLMDYNRGVSSLGGR
jgi:hypothetical protein